MSGISIQTPVVLTVSSHDPSGSTGIQADIETCTSLGCHCTPIISALCARDTLELKDLIPVDTGFMMEQVRTILEDMPVKAIKLGFLGNVGHIEAMHSILRDYPGIPLLVDPVAHLGQQGNSETAAVIEATKTLLLPLALIATPDLVEAHELAQQADNLDACAQEILDCGCDYALITGTQRTHDCYDSSLYNRQGLVRHYSRERLSIFSHGCGATLSASITAYLAHGLRLMDAVEQGQAFTWHSLHASRQLGMGRMVPNRLFWADKNHRDH
jgi:hydroxymethylpyrimidine/phosphomethylpyrimidine kinase